MQRKNFLSSLISFAAILTGFAKLNRIETMQVEKVYFKDDGQIPNSKYPLLLYRQAFTGRNDEGASWLENRFANNNWTNSWRNGDLSVPSLPQHIPRSFGNLFRDCPVAYGRRKGAKNNG